MKKTIVVGILILALGALTPPYAQAQGTLYLSSLSPTSTGSVAVGSDSWLAAGVYTGNNAGGYSLNSIQLGLTDATGNPSGFGVMLYSEAQGTGSILPGSSLGTLTGSSDPGTVGTYIYTAPSGLSLSPATVYFIVITSGTKVSNGSYNWSESAYPPGVSAWGLGINGIDTSNNGTSDWSPTPYLGIAQFAIYATPAPEPGVLGLFALGGLLVAFQRRKMSSLQ
jgi:hypothetical protein